MTCLDEEKLWEYLDGEITSSQKVLMDNHLEKCPDCKDQLAELTLFNTEISNAVLAQPSLRFTKNVMELIEVELNPMIYKPLLRRIWKRFAIFGFATMIVTLVFVALLFPNGQVPFEGTINTLFVYTQNPLILNSILIILSLWVLYLVDRFLLSTNRTIIE